MSEKHIVLLTGGNTGIGYETVKALYASPETYTILMGSRTLSKAQAAIETLRSEMPGSKSDIVPIQLDIEDDQSILDAYEEVKSSYSKIDTLINNAGALPNPHPTLSPHTTHPPTNHPTNLPQAAPSTAYCTTTHAIQHPQRLEQILLGKSNQHPSANDDLGAAPDRLRDSPTTPLRDLGPLLARNSRAWEDICYDSPRA
ncbi:uncharacterized protein EKO05_0011170 [Ascochyta rabiei]|uniref:Oxidoreductase n=1 Tax=Didymella rabiei TaxID=5454 RepID=A0A163A6T7_DIDRA|nr:uncharacterized protein EKO05_0011170 [Ascochyta rabiei]KZM21017.1 oxidoreductase [Ascochyta rabiei]UPX20963.1 hypothetical protein EKO05_0011170 [Ascochyta rabiei]